VAISSPGGSRGDYTATGDSQKYFPRKHQGFEGSHTPISWSIALAKKCFAPGNDLCSIVMAALGAQLVASVSDGNRSQKDNRTPGGMRLKEMVARGGIEPPTRGFSVAGTVALAARKYKTRQSLP